MTTIEKIGEKQSHKLRGFCLLLMFSIFILGLSSWNTAEEIPKTAYVLRYPSYFGNRINTTADNPMTEEGVDLGRRLFYETLLSANNSLSCGSCHMQEKAFTDGKKLSRGVDGELSERNAMSLVNLLWARKFFWDGRSVSLEEQASIPMVNPHEMGQSLLVSSSKLQQTSAYPELFSSVFGDEQITGKRIVMAIAQFERTLISANSNYDKYLQKSYQLSREEMNGMILFNTAPNPEKGIRGANCAHCHGGPKNYLELFHNNGLDRVSADPGIQQLSGQRNDHGRFKVPTLRNIALTAPYMHDGRFNSLEEVIDHYSEHVQQSESLSAFLQHESNIRNVTSLKLRPQEKKELLAFLHTLTDTAFISNPKFSNPFLIRKINKTK